MKPKTKDFVTYFQHIEQSIPQRPSNENDEIGEKWFSRTELTIKTATRSAIYFLSTEVTGCTEENLLAAKSLVRALVIMANHFHGCDVFLKNFCQEFEYSIIYSKALKMAVHSKNRDFYGLYAEEVEALKEYALKMEEKYQ